MIVCKRWDLVKRGAVLSYKGNDNKTRVILVLRLSYSRNYLCMAVLPLRVLGETRWIAESTLKACGAGVVRSWHAGLIRVLWWRRLKWEWED
jgi:hypothetical protein